MAKSTGPWSECSGFRRGWVTGVRGRSAQSTLSARYATRSAIWQPALTSGMPLSSFCLHSPYSCWHGRVSCCYCCYCCWELWRWRLLLRSSILWCLEDYGRRRISELPYCRWWVECNEQLTLVHKAQGYYCCVDMESGGGGNVTISLCFFFFVMAEVAVVGR